MKNILFAALVLFSLKSSAQIACNNYNTANSPIPSNQIYGISSLAADSVNYDDIWIGTEAGLVHYNAGNWTTYTTADGLPDNSIRSVLVTPDTAVWVGTFIGGMAKFKNGVFTVYNSINSNLPDNFVRAFAYEAPGILWIGTPNGLARLVNDTITAFDLSNLGLESTHVAALAVRPDNSKVIGMINGGFAYYNDTTFTFYTHTNSNLPDNTVVSIALDPLGNPYLAMPSGGLVAHFGGNIWQIYNEGLFPEMGTNSFRCLAADPWGMWAGSVNKGVFRKMGTGNFLAQNTLNWYTPTQPADFVTAARFPSACFKHNSQYLYGWFGSDQGGLYSVNSVTAINENPVDNTVTAWLADGNTIVVKSANKLLQVNAYSIDGRLITQAKPEGTFTKLDTNNNSGIFIIRTVTAKGVAVNKVVVE